MTDETIVAIYDSATRADAAVRDLEAANVPASAISRHQASSTTGTEQATTREPGFWSKLFGGETEYDTAVYDRSLAGGSSVVTVKVPDEHVASVTRILESHSPIDIDETATGYGLTGAAATTTTTREATVGVVPANPAGGEQVLALSEEQMNVGKRLVNRGSTRVRRYVTEAPVEENVTLHSETVSIERRPASADARSTDADFSDRVIEVTESSEEAVVGKTARVREEVVIRKDVADRVETVRDTVRREDVEITKDGVVQNTGTGPVTQPAIRTTGPTAPSRPGI